ncbi:hypothetical protein [Vibrio alginolyticus]|uniref:hypothetical protein n=1 Tax=Vibrio alginolyticus TaxID=663 RepID=UPI001586CF52|nr:hypothetical protein [Vibrio alginolyticus]ELB1500442.1 hypothetical protein [Vibrio alginolyticus]
MYKTIQRLVEHHTYRIGQDSPFGYNNTEDKVSVLWLMAIAKQSLLVAFGK